MKVFFESLGWLGTFCFLWSYFMLIQGKWQATQKIFHWYNIIGSVLFVINGLYYSAWAVVFINFVWGIINCYGLYKTTFSK